MDNASVGNNTMGRDGAGSTRPSAPQAPPAPDPVDIEAAKKATDLVLDSLKTQRDTPDPALLDKLGWTPDQLRRFVDRWEGLRQKGNGGDAAADQQWEQSLRSLGIRPPGSTDARRSSGTNDQLRDVFDAGQQMEPPPQFRDAIDAFRRSLNK
jgi:hypothetical protein